METLLNRNQLFKLLTSHKDWFLGFDGYPPYCDKNAAAVLKHRHNKAELGQEAYDSLAAHFGFKKELLYIK